MPADPRIAAGRLNAQLLVRPVSRVEAVAERLLAVQAQDPRGFRLAIRSRSSGCTAADVDAALTERRSLVVSWLCRGTLHLVGSADYAWLHALTAARMTRANARRLEQTGVDAQQTARGVGVIVETLADGPRSRAELQAALSTADVPTAGQALVHLLVAASLREHVVRGPMRAGEHCFVDARRWLGPIDAPDRDACLTMLGRRYLVGHGPATPADLAAYAGITRADARRAFDLIADETRPFPGGLTVLTTFEHSDAMPGPRLLGMFDPVLHGWTDRSFVTGPHTGVVTTNGLFRATALVGGRVVATWGLTDGIVTVKPLQRLDPAVRPRLEAEAADVQRFLGLPHRPLVVAATESGVGVERV